MLQAIGLLLASICRFFHTRRRLLLENLALRQQLAVLKRRHPRPRLAAFDKIFWVLAQRFWSDWKRALIMVSPETVVRWHRSGFALYWRTISRARLLLNSWSLSGIVTLQSGTPFSIFGQDSAFQATRADLAPGRTVASAIKSGAVVDRLNAYFDTTAFVQPAAFGDLGRNIIRGPKQTNTDFSIMKSILVTESQRGRVPGRVL